MKKEDFISKEKIHELKVFDEIFKYKEPTAGDELDWLKDYTEFEEVIIEGKKFIKSSENEAKLSVCKLRNIFEVPFNKEELNQMVGVNKNFKDFTPEEKDLFFRKLDPKIYNMLIRYIDDIKLQKKE